MKLRFAALLLASSVLATVAATDAGAQTITSGGYTAGIGPNGELFDYASYIGFQNPAGDDYISPGTPRDSWGITGSTGSAVADQTGSTFNILSTVASFGTSSATLTSTLANGLTVKQFYTFFAPNILSVQETISNDGSKSPITDIVFRRDVDLDIPPTLFNENVVGVFGSNASVVGNSYYGFESADPSSPFANQCGTSCNVAGDLGAGIDFAVGTLGAGESKTFAYYYGINQPGQNLTQLFTQAQGLGLSYLIGAQSRENGDYPALGGRSAFLGVSNVGVVAGGVPEPASWAMMIGGFGFAGAALRRRRYGVKVSMA